MKYKRYTLKELATIKYGKNQAKVVTTEKKYPIYGTGGLMGYATQFLYDKPSVLIGRKGTIDKIRYVEHPFWTVDTLFYTEINTDLVIPEYFYYALSLVDLAKHNEGTTIPSLRTDTLNKIEFDIPDIEDQRRIIGILRPISDKIALNEKINNNLEQQAFALFDSLFPRTIDGSQTIGDYIIPKRGRNLLSKDAVYGTVPVVAGGLEPSTYHNVANTKAPVLTISASGANAGFVNLWLNSVWSSDSSYIDYSMTPNVFFWYILLKGRQKEIFDAQTGSAQPHIYPQHIAAMPVGDLNQELVFQFTTQVAPLFELIGANKDENERLRNIRDALLPRLMSGEIDVSDICI